MIPATPKALEVALEGWTLRDILAHGVIDYHPTPVGPASVTADHMQERFEAGACDGFWASIDVYEDGVDTFVDEAVPLLRRPSPVRAGRPAHGPCGVRTTASSHSHTIDEGLLRSAIGPLRLRHHACRGPIGFTCQSFYSVSVDPSLVSFSVIKTSTATESAPHAPTRVDARYRPHESCCRTALWPALSKHGWSAEAG
ncbi:flavin reductase family protein [Pseudarthrobacter sulfonivorans]|uniref:flavin reductase family protein n=1 Tax=Pseudarthrobacter sulfonivorans TaxID=121292 RepID=UPI002787B3E3|nr:flavin reductase family protein [Pseudarthrobacter sulfonivorans]MDQ0000164.1 hypothetical protein [Pseudarthrobacter sulfonivorans]